MRRRGTGLLDIEGELLFSLGVVDQHSRNRGSVDQVQRMSGAVLCTSCYRIVQILYAIFV